MTLATTINIGLRATLATALDLVTASADLNIAKQITMATGTATGLADQQWSDTRTIAASGNEDLDLAASLTGPLGGTLTFVKLKGLYVAAAAANVNNVIVTRPASNGVPIFAAASDAVPVLPGGVLLWVAPGAGITVTAATGDLINFSNSSSGTSVTYDVVFIGTSA